MLLPQSEKLNYIIKYFISYAGDLTDAKNKDELGSKQILEEWQHYKFVIDKTKIKDRTLWLDVRGNHGETSKRFFSIACV